LSQAVLTLTYHRVLALHATIHYDALYNPPPPPSLDTQYRGSKGTVEEFGQDVVDPITS